MSFMAAIPQFFKVAQQVGKGFRIESWGAQTPPRRKDLRFDVPSRANSWADDSALTLLELERRHIERVLQEEHGYVDQTARRLGIPRSSLYQKIKKHGIVLTKV